MSHGNVFIIEIRITYLYRLLIIKNCIIYIISIIYNSNYKIIIIISFVKFQKILDIAIFIKEFDYFSLKLTKQKEKG